MRKDPTAFRERFKRWKNGERVYDNGTPITDSYDGGKDDLDSLLDAGYTGPYGTKGYTSDQVNSRIEQRRQDRNNAIADRLQAAADATMLGVGLTGAGAIPATAYFGARGIGDISQGDYVGGTINTGLALIPAYSKARRSLKAVRGTNVRDYFKANPSKLSRYDMSTGEGKQLSEFWNKDVVPRMKKALGDEGAVSSDVYSNWFNKNFAQSRRIWHGTTPFEPNPQGYSEGTNTIVFADNGSLFNTPEKRYSSLAHELHHSQRSNTERFRDAHTTNSNNGYTAQEEAALNNAYQFSEGFLNKHNIRPLHEKGAANTQLRATISANNGNATGKRLNKFIDNTSDEEITKILKSGSSYGADFVNSPTYNTKNIRKALKYVGGTAGVAYGLNKYDGGKDSFPIRPIYPTLYPTGKIIDFMSNTNWKDVAYRIMNQSPAPSRNLPDVIDAIHDSRNNAPHSNFRYTGSHLIPTGNGRVEDVLDRDLNHLIVYGNTKNQYTPKKLIGFDYSDYIKNNYEVDTLPTYEGQIINAETVNIPHEYKNLVEFFAQNPTKYGYYSEPSDPYFNKNQNNYDIIEDGKNKFKVVDDVNSYRRSFRFDKNGNAELAAQDIIDYKSGYGSKHSLLGGLQGQMLHGIINSPVILDQGVPVKYTDDPKDYQYGSGWYYTLKHLVDNHKILSKKLNDNSFQYPLTLPTVEIIGNRKINKYTNGKDKEIRTSPKIKPLTRFQKSINYKPWEDNKKIDMSIAQKDYASESDVIGTGEWPIEKLYRTISPNAIIGVPGLIVEGINYLRNRPLSDRTGYIYNKGSDALWKRHLGYQRDFDEMPVTGIRFRGDYNPDGSLRLPNAEYTGIPDRAKRAIVRLINNPLFGIFDNVKVPDDGSWGQRIESFWNDYGALEQYKNFALRENNNSRILDFVDTYDFPETWWFPSINRPDGYQIEVRDTIHLPDAKPWKYDPDFTVVPKSYNKNTQNKTAKN